MIARILGIIKVALVLSVDYAIVYNIFERHTIAIFATGAILAFVAFGGYISLLKDGAVNSSKLPAYQGELLDSAKKQLTADVKEESRMNIKGLKVYLIPENGDMNGTAYGFNCVSVTRGTLENADSVTLNAVLAHEVSHILNLDPEFNRAVFCSISLVMVALGIASFGIVAILFILFLLVGCFRSFFGILVFRGTTNLVRGFFNMLNKAVVVVYRSLLSLVSRHAEYRCDIYACSLGYGLQLAHFLSVTDAFTQRSLTLSDTIYRSHPPTEKRIARLERKMFETSHNIISDNK